MSSLEKFLLSVQYLHPGNFALVMATGIISIGMGLLGNRVLADMLFLFAVCAWMVLLALSLLRLLRFATRLRDELLNPRMVFSYFTLVAATNIIG